MDHTFRFYEPESSSYLVKVPPFISMNQSGLKFDISDPECKAALIGDTNYISLEGET